MLRLLTRISSSSSSLSGGPGPRGTYVRARRAAAGLWRVYFPPCLVRPGRRLPVQGLSEGSLPGRPPEFLLLQYESGDQKEVAPR